jgi:hypothetical protein
MAEQISSLQNQITKQDQETFILKKQIADDKSNTPPTTRATTAQTKDIETLVQ